MSDTYNIFRPGGEEGFGLYARSPSHTEGVIGRHDAKRWLTQAIEDGTVTDPGDYVVAATTVAFGRSFPRVFFFTVKPSAALVVA